MRTSLVPALARSVARSVDAPSSLIPLLPALFEDLDSLGSTPRRIAAMLGRAGLGRGARVLDLGCGKGAAAIEVSARLGCRVLGIDGFGPFVESARAAAARRGVARRCSFRIGDALRFRTPRRFDGAMMLGLFGVERAAPLLRALVRPGGVYLIDDAYLDEESGRVSGVQSYAEVRGVLAGAGDRVVEEYVMPRSVVRALNTSLYRRLARSARRLAVLHPRHADALNRFLLNQRRANRVLETALRPAIWVVRRGS